MAREMAPPPAEEAGAGGGATEAFVEANSLVAQTAQMVRNNGQIPEAIKEQFMAAAQAYAQGLEALTEFAGGGEGATAMGGVVTPEQGGSRGAIPVTPAGAR